MDPDGGGLNCSVLTNDDDDVRDDDEYSDKVRTHTHTSSIAIGA